MDDVAQDACQPQLGPRRRCSVCRQPSAVAREKTRHTLLRVIPMGHTLSYECTHCGAKLQIGSVGFVFELLLPTACVIYFLITGFPGSKVRSVYLVILTLITTLFSLWLVLARIRNPVVKSEEPSKPEP